jgi:putative endonuclease
VHGANRAVIERILWAYSKMVLRPDGHRGGRVMNYLYILQSQKNDSYYIGSTNDIERRVLEHNFGKTISTKNLRPLKLVFKKEFECLSDARHAEIVLKKKKSRVIIEKIIADQEIKMGL